MQSNHRVLSWLSTQPIKFIFVGILNTIFGYLVFAGLLWTGLHYSYALFVATCLCVLFNFKSIGILVFNNRKNQLLLRFILLYATLYGVNIVLIYCLNFLYPNVYINGIIAIPFTALISFFGNKYFIFR
jgi:putative flippase GtrA